MEDKKYGICWACGYKVRKNENICGDCFKTGEYNIPMMPQDLPNEF